MRIIICLYLFLFFGNKSEAQKKTDSLRYYQYAISKKYKTLRDSLFKDPEFIRLSERAREIAAGTDSYSSFLIYSALTAGYFSKFNAENSSAGMAPISDNIISVGFGFSLKRKRAVFDITLLSFGIRKKTKKCKPNNFHHFQQCFPGRGRLRLN